MQATNHHARLKLIARRNLSRLGNWVGPGKAGGTMHNFVGNLLWHDQRSSTNDLARRQSFLLEPLEGRLLLSADPLATTALSSLDQAGVASTIVWGNRGAATDNFDAAFGAGAAADAARAVVDAAIDA